MASPPKMGYAQDMPPPGGYGPVQWQRIKLKTVFGPKLTIGIFVASSIFGWTGYYFSVNQKHRHDIEMRSAIFALAPMLIAERDRMFLKQMKINRDLERELMKNVPEWDVGTYFREPVYITMPDKFHEPSYGEFMVHGNFWDVSYQAWRRHFS